MKISAKYKWWSIVVQILSLVFAFYIFSDRFFSISSFFQVNKFAFLIFFFLLLSILRFVFNLRKFDFSRAGIEQNHFLFPVFQKEEKWHRLDYFIEMTESKKSVLIFVRDQKVEFKVSSEFYSNYDEIKKTVSEFLPYKGKMELNFFQRMKLNFGHQIDQLPRK